MSSVMECQKSLQDAILGGKYAAGQRLQPERVLARELGVGRVTLRSALGVLAARGLVRARQGSGYIVQPIHRSGAGAALLPELQRLGAVPFDELVTDLLRVRRHLAAALLEHLRHMPSVDASAVHDAVEHMANLPPRSAAADFALADRAILEAIVRSSKSITFELMLLPVTRVLMEIPALHPLLYAQPETNVLAYRAVVAWLASDRTSTLPLLDILSARDAQTLKEISS